MNTEQSKDEALFWTERISPIVDGLQNFVENDVKVLQWNGAIRQAFKRATEKVMYQYQLAGRDLPDDFEVIVGYRPEYVVNGAGERYELLIALDTRNGRRWRDSKVSEERHGGLHTASVYSNTEKEITMMTIILSIAYVALSVVFYGVLYTHAGQ